MRHLTVSILVTVTVLLGSAGESFALPECPGSPTISLNVTTSWNNCKGTFAFASGSKYVGEWKDGNRHGQGTVTFSDGEKYVGEWKDDKYHGKGTETYASGRKYVGDWKDGKSHGQGTETFANGNKYVGEWKDDKYHGQGTGTFANGNKYVGDWKDGKSHGQGTYTTANGDKYVGEFKYGKSHGQGTLTYANGDKYVGEWKDGKWHGQGTQTYADGRVEEGIWENHVFKYAQKVTPTVIAKKTPPPSKGEGFALPECPGSPTNDVYIWREWNNCKGTYTSAYGNKYVGEWKDGYKHGQGTLTFADGRVEEGIWENHEFKYAQKITPTVTAKKTLPPSKGESFALPECPGTYNASTWTDCVGTFTFANGIKYVGEFKYGNFHGQGTETLASGDKYVGEFKDGKMHGQGTYTYAHGGKYVGEYKDDKANGQGTFTFADGEKQVGEWKDGKKHGQGTVTYADGDKYVGELKDGKKHGQGTVTYAYGDKYVGEHKDGKKHGQGTYTTNDGVKYVGEWKNDLPNGLGVRTYADGSKYVGEFRYSNKHGQGTFTHASGRIEEGIFQRGEFIYAKKTTPTVTAKKSPKPSSEVQNENERLRKKIARLEKEKKQKPKPAKQVAKRTPPKPSPPPSKTGTSGSGFFVSKSGHVITNQHIVSDCGKVTVGDNAKKQVTADVLETDRRNDLALLKISSTKMASVETKSLISKLGITVVPLASHGLLRSEDVELGEDVLVSGYPYGDIFSNTIKVTKGIVSANRGFGDDTGQFQMDAAVQPGNSGGPIYDENGNIVGVVVAQLNKMKFAKAIGSIPENVNFGIKASTVRQFLTASGLPTKWSKRSKRMSTKQLAKIAKNQTVMVVCHP